MTCLVFSLLGDGYGYWEESAYRLARAGANWRYSPFFGNRPLYRIRIKFK
jgi:hypothetical protein